MLPLRETWYCAWVRVNARDDSRDKKRRTRTDAITRPNRHVNYLKNIDFFPYDILSSWKVSTVSAREYQRRKQEVQYNNNQKKMSYTNVKIESLCTENFDTLKIQIKALLIKNDTWKYVSET